MKVLVLINCAPLPRRPEQRGYAPWGRGIPARKASPLCRLSNEQAVLNWWELQTPLEVNCLVSLLYVPVFGNLGLVFRTPNSLQC